MRHAGEIGVLVHNVPVRQLLVAFTIISVRSWGGGSGTIYTMQHELVHRGWVTSGQFGLDFGISRLAPGINLIALAVILGYRLNGPIGSIASGIAFVLPFSVITLVLTIGFVYVASNPLGAAAVAGAVAVTAALTYALAFETAQSWVPWGERRVAVLMAACMVASFLLVAVLHVSVVFVIVGSGIAGALFFRPREGGSLV